MQKKVRDFWADFGFYCVGCAVYAAAVQMFITPNRISPGGLTGIATALGYLWHFPNGILLLLLNLPILFFGFRQFGGIFIIKTAVATGLLSLALTAAEWGLPAFTVEPILAAIFGGILMGTGLSLILLRGATTGGVDIIAKLFNRRFPHLTVGRIILALDAVVILFAAAVYRNIESALYSVITMYASSRVTDAVLYGADRGKILYIVSKEYRQICTEVNSVLRRGVTVLQATGGYTGESRVLLLCTVRRHEVAAVCGIIRKLDKNAFIVVGEAGEIIGEGFKRIE